MEEAERLRLLHLREYPDYKYRPAKRRPRTQPKQQQQNLPPQQQLPAALSASMSDLYKLSGSSWASSSASRISISTGQRGVLKSIINTSRLQHRVTIDRKFKAALRRASCGSSSGTDQQQQQLSAQPAGFLPLGGQTGGQSSFFTVTSHSSSTLAGHPRDAWPSRRRPACTQSVPASPDLAAVAAGAPSSPYGNSASSSPLYDTPAATYGFSSSSCPNTPLMMAQSAATGYRPHNISDQPLLQHTPLPHHLTGVADHRWIVKEEEVSEQQRAVVGVLEEAASAALPDLAEMFRLDQEDLRLDWPDPEQLTSLSLNTEDLDFTDSWLNKEIFSNIF